MSDSAIITSRLDELQQEWEEKHLEPSLRKMPESQAEFTTVSLKPIERLYTPRDVGEIDFERYINFPGMPREALDDAAIRGFRLGVRHQSAFQIPARTRSD